MLMVHWDWYGRSQNHDIRTLESGLGATTVCFVSEVLELAVRVAAYTVVEVLAEGCGLKLLGVCWLDQSAGRGVRSFRQGRAGVTFIFE